MSRRHVAGVAAAGLLLTGWLSGCSSGGTSGGSPGASGPTIVLPTTTTSTLPPATTSTTTTSTTSTTTTEAPTTAPADLTTTTVADPSAADLVLTTAGIGSAEFGAEPESVIGFVTAFLGTPSTDTGWVDPFSLGTCPGNELRQVSWGSLTLTFGDTSALAQERRHFFAYSYGVDGQINVPPVGLATDRQITVGSRVVDLLAAYPGVILNPEDDFLAPNFYVNDSLRGYMTGLADDDTVTVILGGLGCTE